MAERPGDIPVVVRGASQGERLLTQRSCSPLISEKTSKCPRAVKCLRTQGGRSIRVAGEHPLQPVQPLSPMKSLAKIPAQRRRHLQPGLKFQRPGERRPYIIPFDLQPVEPGDLLVS